MKPKSKKQAKIDKRNKSDHNKAKEINKAYKNPVLRISLKFLLVLLIILICIIYSDKKGYFNPDQTNNHTLKKWNAFYDFTKRNDVDILLFGNSHLYTGINPKNLSVSLGANAFILASPGTNISDSYFSLKEAIKRCDPKIVIIETYGINDFNQYQLSEGGLTDQFKSFSARKDILSKILATPLLFSYENIIYAWSKTIRNHDYIFNNTKQLKKNKKIIDRGKVTKKQKLYLGRYVRFTSGLEDSLLTKYKVEGAPVDGSEYNYSAHAEKYVHKIVKLCKENDIELVFLTLPMYKDHVKDYAVWKDKIGEILNKYSTNKWINMQVPPLYNDFSPICFENTYSGNQHLTLQGSLIATYQLSNFLKESFSNKIPDRKKEQKWNNVFYAEEGYFENNTPKPGDKNNKVLYSNKKIRNLNLKEVLVLTNEKKKTKRLLIKIDRKLLNNIVLERSRLRLMVKVNQNGQEKVGVAVLMYDKLHETWENAIFVQNLADVEVVEIIDAVIEFS